MRRFFSIFLLLYSLDIFTQIPEKISTNIVPPDTIFNFEEPKEYYFYHNDFDCNMYFPDSISQYYDANINPPKNFIQYFNFSYKYGFYFEAFSNPTKYEKSPDGYLFSENYPQKITHEKFPKDSFSIFIDTTKFDTYQKKFYGYSAYMFNTTNLEYAIFVTSGNYAYRIQGIDINGEWKYIDLEFQKKCGNGCYFITLDTKEYWKFSFPIFNGNYNTKLRIEFRYYNYPKQKEELIGYSNEIEANINFELFYLKPTYNDIEEYFGKNRN